MISYRATTESVPRYGIISWFGNLTTDTKDDKSVRKVIGVGALVTPRNLIEQTTLGQKIF